MKASLKTKLITAFLLLISIPMILLGIFSYNRAASALQATVDKHVKDVVELTAKAIESATDHTKQLLESITFSDSIALAIREHSSSAAAYSTEEDEPADGEEGSEASDGETEASSSDGMEPMHEGEGAQSNALNEAFSYISMIQKENADLFESIILTDSTGKAVMTNESLTSQIDVSEREYFKKAVAGETAVSDILVSKMTGNQVVAVAYPIHYENQVIGVLVGTVKFDKLASHAADVQVGKTGYAYMTDMSGKIVYHRNKEMVEKEQNILDVKSESLQKHTKKMLAGETGHGFYTYNGVYKYVRFHPAENWVLAVTADYNDYMGSAIGIRNFTIIMIVAFIIIAMVIALYISLGIVNSIKKLQMLMDKAGKGDLTVVSDINTKDEIQALGESFNNMIANQESIVKQVRDGAMELTASSEEMAASSEEVSAATEEISASIQEVSKDAQNQNTSVIETSKVLVQLSSLVQLAQNRAMSTENNANRTYETALAGRDKVKDTVNAMGHINVSTEETVEVLKVLNELSEKVGGIISTINSIAEQTNLLALNAAIEAARAGEHGRGFAVVADEVRKLSEQSNEGAKQIEGLVNEMMRQTVSAVESINSSKKAVDNGVVVAEQTDRAFLDIIKAVEEITNNVLEIADITKDEVATSDQIIKLIDTIASAAESTTQNSLQVASSTQEQAAAVETLAATAEETSAMAMSLDNLVKKFRVRGE